MNERIDQASKLIQASPSDIYAAFTTANALEKWLPPQDMTANGTAFDFRKGGGYQMRLTYTVPEHTGGKTSEHSDEVDVRFIKLIPNKRIEQGVSFLSDKKEFTGEMEMTWLFDETENGTNVTVECRNVPEGIRPEDHKVGLTSSLENLAAFVEQSR